MLQELQKQVEEYKKTHKELYDLVKNYVQNKDYPLDDRWQLFKDSGFGEEKPFVEDFEVFDYDNDFFTDRLYIERCQTVQLCDVDEYMKENKDELEKLKINRDKFREEVLQKFIKSFIFDW